MRMTSTRPPDYPPVVGKGRNLTAVAPLKDAPVRAPATPLPVPEPKPITGAPQPVPPPSPAPSEASNDPSKPLTLTVKVATAGTYKLTVEGPF